MTPDPLLTEVAGLIPAMQQRAVQLDADEQFPEQDMQALRDLGVLAAPLPVQLGGRGAGLEPEGAEVLIGLLTAFGQGNLSIGRLFEAHVNALQLVDAFGTTDQVERAATDAKQGKLFGLWVTDGAGHPLVLDAERLQGGKGPCSGGTHVSRALVTVQTTTGARMAVIEVSRATVVKPLRGVLQGMRASANAVVSFDNVPCSPEAFVGQPGDYLREPHLSTGAWRTSAVTLGGLNALVAATGQQLARKGHQDAPLQQDRFGRMLIAQETARLGVVEAAHRTEAQQGTVGDRVAYVNLARIAVEAACLDAMRLAQRALGLSAFICPNPVERLLRDLAVYLRQPAPDAVLTEAARHVLVR